MSVPVTLREWLLDVAHIPASRVDTLMMLLSDNWVTDVPALRRCLVALESKLPTGAYVSIAAAMVQEPRQPQPELPQPDGQSQPHGEPPHEDESRVKELDEREGAAEAARAPGSAAEEAADEQALAAQMLLRGREREAAAARRREEVREQVRQMSLLDELGHLE